jgi:hypothetical protein
MNVDRRRVCAVVAMGVSAPAIWAQSKPAGPVILTVRGKVDAKHAAAGASFDDAMLAQMPQREIKTRTPWHEGVKSFSGPLLRDVLKAVGAQGTLLRAIALNDYRVDLPAEDADRFDVVIARLLDGKPMPVRDKGPLFIMYPFDEKPELRVPQYFGRCAWQLRTIEVL